MEEQPTINWQDILGWGEEHFQDLRYLGYTFYREGHYEEAYTYFAALVELCPDSAYDHQTLGAIQLQLNNDEHAVELLDKALSLDPTDELSLLNKTKALLMLGKKNDALAIARRIEKSADAYLANDASALIMAYA